MSGYLEIQQAAREVDDVLEIYYFRAKEPRTADAMSGKLNDLEYTMKVGSGFSRGSSFVDKSNATHALDELVKVKEKYADISSDRVNSAVDQFLNVVMDDLKKREQKENDTESFHKTAREHLKQAFARLTVEINQASGIDQLPIK